MKILKYIYPILISILIITNIYFANIAYCLKLPIITSHIVTATVAVQVVATNYDNNNDQTTIYASTGGYFDVSGNLVLDIGDEYQFDFYEGEWHLAYHISHSWNYSPDTKTIWEEVIVR